MSRAVYRGVAYRPCREDAVLKCDTLGECFKKIVEWRAINLTEII